MALLAVIGYATATALAAKAPKVHSGGTAIMVQFGQDATMDPAINTVYSFTDGPPMAAVYGELAYANPATGATEMGFAKSITPSDHYRKWTITLHPGLKFSDGTAFNAAAVALDIARDANPATNSPFSTLASSLKVKVLSSTALRLTLPYPNTQFPAVVAQDFIFIPSPTAIAREGSSFATEPVGAGPFKITNWAIGSSIQLTRNPYYSLFAKGQPYINTLDINNLLSTSQEVAAVGSGSGQLAWVQGGQFIQQMQAAGAGVKTYFSSGGAPMQLNNSIAPFNNPTARKALADALSPAGLGSAWLPSTPGSVNLFSPSSPFYNKKYNLPPQNAAQAQQLFNQLAAAGTPVNFTVQVPVGFPALGPYIQSQLAQYKNVNVTVQTDLTSQYLTNLRDGDYQMTIGSLYWTNPVPLAILNFQTGGAANYEHWSDPKVDAALAVIQTTTNLATEKKEWGIVQQQYLADVPDLLAQRGEFGVAYNKSQITGLNTFEYGNIPLWGELQRIG
jgi:peptide/nickel transport system substrate-binding protein